MANPRSSRFSTRADDFYGQVKRSGSGREETNIQPYITFTRRGTWIVCWTQTSEEVEPGQRPDQRAVCSRSTDAGRTFGPEIVIEDADNTGEELPPHPHYTAPTTAGSDEIAHEGGSPTVEPPTCRARVPAWPMVFTAPYLDRVYAFYWYNVNGSVYRDAGSLCFKYSDDDGATWSDRHRVTIRRTAIDEPGFDMHGWNFGPPIVLQNGKVMMSFTKMRATTVPQLFENWHTEVFFLVAENLLGETDPSRLRFTTYPVGERGLIVPSRKTGKPFAQEATIVSLSSGQLLAVMRTDTGFIYHSVSGDGGANWSQPAVFRASPGGVPLRQPVCPAPITKLGDGRYVLLFHNNDGTANGGVGPYSSLRNRSPLWLACARQARGVEENGGLIFGPPRVIIENDVRPKGRTNRTDISYPRFFQYGDRYFVVYNHRKLDINVHEIDPAFLSESGLPV